MSDHARLSPSNPRWIPCPASIKACANYPNTTSKAAEDGTRTHLLLEICLKNKFLTADLFIGQTVNGWEVDAERVKRVNVALKYVDKRVSELSERHDDVVVQAEQRVNVGVFFDRDDWWGTCDIAIQCYSGSILEYVEVIDYKDGGMYVKVENNSQLLQYLYPFVVRAESNIHCSITIVQPKIVKDQVRTQQLTRYTVCAAVDEYYQSSLITDLTHATFKSGEHCRYCPHKLNCEEVKRVEVENLDSTEHLMSQVHGDLAALSGDILAQMLGVEKSYNDAFTRVKEEVKKRIGEGEEVGRYFLGKGRITKKWSLPDDEIEKKLKGMRVKKPSIFPSKFLSPTQALLIEGLKDSQIKNLNDLIIEEEGKPQLKLAETESNETIFKGV